MNLFFWLYSNKQAFSISFVSVRVCLFSDNCGVKVFKLEQPALCWQAGRPCLCLLLHYVRKMQSKWPAVKRRAFGQICIKSIPFDKVILHVNLTMHSSIHLLLDKLLHAGWIYFNISILRMKIIESQALLLS